MKDIGFKRVISLEPQALYYHWMEGMAQESNGVLEVLKKDGYDWEAYNDLKDPKYIGNMETKDWSTGKKTTHFLLKKKKKTDAVSIVHPQSFIYRYIT